MLCVLPSLSYYYQKVIGCVTKQIKQLRQGLKETPIWTVLTQTPDTVGLLFPEEGAGNISPEVILYYSDVIMFFS